MSGYLDWRNLDFESTKGFTLDIRIGIQNSPREISFDSADSHADLEKSITSAIESKAAVVSFTDSKGVTYLVPTSTISYVEIGAESARRVGFVS